MTQRDIDWAYKEGMGIPTMQTIRSWVGDGGNVEGMDYLM